MNTDKRIRKLAFGGVFTALIAAATMFLKLPVPITSGYVHLGDGMIFAASAYLGPWGAVAGALGSALADLLGGYAYYMIPTAIVKGAMGLIAGLYFKKAAGKKFSFLKAALLFVLCEAVMVLGYFLAECIMYNAQTAAGAILPNLIQGVSGVVIGLVFSPVVLRVKEL